MLTQLEQERAGLAAKLSAHSALASIAIDQDFEVQLVERIRNWRSQLRDNVKAARIILKRLIDGTIVFTPTDNKGYVFEGSANLAELISIGGALSVASPAGFEPALPA